eukprot:371668_1
MILVTSIPSFRVNLFLWITINCLFHYLHAHPGHDQYITIWNDTMDTNNGWIGYNHFQFSTISNKCISSPCSQVVVVDAYDNSWIEKTTNILNYSNIELHIDINADDMEINDACQIWYNYDNNEWIKYGDWRQETFRNEIIQFPDCSTSSIMILRLKAHGDGQYERDRCYWDNAILRGIISTQIPSIYPTLYPTAISNKNPNSQQISHTPQTDSDDIAGHYDMQNNVPGHYDNITLTISLAIFIGGAALCSVVILITRQIIMKKENKLKNHDSENKSSDACGLQRTDSQIVNTKISHSVNISPLTLTASEIQPCHLKYQANGNKNVYGESNI